MKLKQIFAASEFTPTAFDTSEDKAWFANYFVYFAEADFRESLFAERFYNRLSLRFFHIAHYNRNGFFGVWFSSTPRKAEFLRRSLNHHPCGHPAFTYCDAESAIQRYLRASSLPERYEIQVRAETEALERALLSRLKAKYEPGGNAPIASAVAGATTRSLTRLQIDLFACSGDDGL